MTKLNKNFQKFLSVFLLFFCGGFIFAAKNASYYFNEGKNLQLAEDWYGAIECFSESTRLNPSYGEAYFKLAECFYAVDEYELSLQNLDLASKYLRNRADLENLLNMIKLPNDLYKYLKTHKLRHNAEEWLCCKILYIVSIAVKIYAEKGKWDFKLDLQMYQDLFKRLLSSSDEYVKKIGLMFGERIIKTIKLQI